MLLLIVALIVLLLLVVFALSNTELVRLGTVAHGLRPRGTPSLSLILGAMAIAFFLGALVVWISALSQRRRARRAENLVRLLEAQVEELKARIAAPLSLPPVT